MARSRVGICIDVHDMLLGNELDGALRIARTRLVSSVMQLLVVPWGSCDRTASNTSTTTSSSARSHGCCSGWRRNRRTEGQDWGGSRRLFGGVLLDVRFEKERNETNVL